MSKVKDLSYDIQELFIDGQNALEIAQALGCPIGVVKGCLEGFGVDPEDVAEKPQDTYFGA